MLVFLKNIGIIALNKKERVFYSGQLIFMLASVHCLSLMKAERYAVGKQVKI